MTTTRPIMNHSARPSTTNDPIRVLSVRQPWAGLIVHGFKALENRDWETSYRGPATARELRASVCAGDEGVIEVTIDGERVACYVEE